MKKELLIPILVLLLLPLWSWSQGNPGPNPKVVSITISQPDEITINATTQDPSFAGTTDGFISLTITGGTQFSNSALYTHSITKDGAPITPTTNTSITSDPNPNWDVYNLAFSDLGAGIYVLSIIDENLCDQTATFTLTDPPLFEFEFADAMDETCVNANDGSITAKAQGGIIGQNYVYQLKVETFPGSGIFTIDYGISDNLAQTLTFSRTGLPPANYKVEVTDNNGSGTRITSNILTVDEVDPINFDVTVNQPSCNAIDDASLSVINITGGAQAYTFVWQKDGVDYSTNASITDLSPGVYEITVFSGDSCPDQLAQVEGITIFPIAYPAPITINLENAGLQQPTTAGAADGAIDILVNGGVSPYTYQWVNLSTGININTDPDLIGLSAGEYQVTVTDFNGCTAAETYVLYDPLEISSTSSTDVLCFGGADGTADIVVTGGLPPYNYSWTKDDDAGFSANTASLSGLDTGNYTLLVTDTETDPNPNTITTTVLIEQPAQAVVIDSFTTTDVLISGQNTGAIDIEVSGGTPGYTYQWTKTGDLDFSETTQDLTNLTAGEYSVEIRDANADVSATNAGCIVTQTFTVVEPLPLSVTITEQVPFLCNGDTNGALLATATGGVEAYQYVWFELVSGNPVALGITTPVIENLLPGEYRVEVTDANGAVAFFDYTFYQPDELIVSLASAEAVSCFGESTGTINIDVAGGTLPYTFEWSDLNGVTYDTEDLTNLPAETYNLILTDANGCSTTLGPVDITQPDDPITIDSFTITNLTGFETNNGSIAVEVSGGTPAYTYQWFDSDLNEVGDSSTLENIPAGEYELLITDAANCTLPATYTVTQPELLDVVSIVENESIPCFTDELGEIEATVTGGVEPYQYEWTEQGDATVLSTGLILSGIGAGTYQIAVTDANGNVAALSYELTQPEALEATWAQSNISCFGGNDGAIDVSVTGGTAPYDYFWSNGLNSQDVGNLIAGTYTLTVRDNNLCETSIEVTLTQPDNPISIASQTIVNTTGNGLNDGSITVEIDGGTPDYSYVWNDADSNPVGTDANQVTDLLAGTYFLNVTDANGCILGPIEFEVTEPAPLTIDITTQPINCFGETGALIAQGVGGVGPYSYEWTDNAGTVISSQESTGDVLAGFYSILVTDANGNTATLTQELTQPNELLITAIDVTDVSCYGGSDGSIELTITGGTGDYIYTWQGGSSTTNILGNITTGEYEVSVTDANTCTVSSGVITVNQPAVFDITAVSLVQPSDEGVFDGSISIQLEGSSPPFDYVWTNEGGDIIQQTLGTSQLTDELLNVQEGIYTITITDAEGCTVVETYNLANPGELLVDIVLNQPITCFGGSDGILEAITTGGVGGNNYAWYDAADDTLLSTANIFTGVSTGNYYLIVSNAEGIQEQSAVFFVDQPLVVSANISFENPSCFMSEDGMISLNATGGNNTFQYRYRFNSGDYGDWIAFAEANTTTVTGLVEGEYDVQVSDTNGCFNEENGNILVLSATLESPEELNLADVILTQPTGNGLSNGSIEVIPQGGTQPYTYAWFDENGVINQTTNLLANISAGTYTLLLTDQNDCEYAQEITLGEPEALSADVAVVNIILCAQDENGSLTVAATGGVPFTNGNPYLYEWFDNTTGAFIANTQTLSNVGAGFYYVIVTDANANTVQTPAIELTEPTALALALTADFENCGDLEDWDVTTTASGGTLPYAFSWSNGSTLENLVDVTPGTYQLILTDANGCTITEEIELIPPPSLAVEETISIPTCYEGDDGEINVEVSGGTPPYTYAWSNGDTTANPTNLEAGDYTLVVTDNKGCALTAAYTVENPEELFLDMIDQVTLCQGQSISLDATIDNGMNYQWEADNGFYSDEAEVELSDAGVYTITVTTTEGCIIEDTLTINESAEVVAADFLVSTQVFTNEEFVLVNVSDQSMEWSEWSLPAEAQIIESYDGYASILFLVPGEYTLSLTVGKGECQDTIQKTVLVVDPENFGSDQNDGQSLITSYIIYPNPSFGNFTVEVTLNEELPISLKIFGMADNTIYDHRTIAQNTLFEESYTLNLASGLYFVLLETPFGSRVQKIVIN
ncbi:hypothetical protein GCM10009117_14710 [Gangjinia marincola]|uniref:Uncharacterized protein n=1 Tax=Gangjinia marincola TaxID=578463 RepID=A0ABN1MGN2_9FLAO